MKKNLSVLILLFTFVFQSSVSAQTATKKNSPAMKAAANITAKQMSDYLYFIASDEMEGRDTPSRGLNTTAKFIAMNLSRWGFKPAGDDGTFFQNIALRGNFPDAAKATASYGGQNFAFGDDYFRLAGNQPVSAPLVYGGDGWFIKSKNIDRLAGVDVKGKIVVIYGSGMPSNFALTALPNGLSQKDLAGQQRGVSWIDPLNYARQKGAVGVIVVANHETMEKWAQFRDYYARPRYAVEKFINVTLGTGNPQLPVIVAAPRMANALFSGETIDPTQPNAAPTAFNLNADKIFSVSVPNKTEPGTTQNVVALWEGSDPVLKGEMVAVGAHYDHIGISNPASSNPDKINNGADDDGSGTTAILSMAEALAKAPKRPKRSILFVWHCGEEKGLWGSRYFTSFPTVPIDKITAQLNIDMIGRSRKMGDTIDANKELSGENEVFVIGSEMMSSTLGAIVKNTNDSFLKLNYNLRYDDPKDPNRFFFRSDHFNYAQKGIPIAFWFDGVHEDYHQPGDEPQKIDYQKMQNITRTIFLTMWETANLRERPKVDKQLPAELTQR